MITCGEAQHEKRGGIYAIRNRIDGKEYVGSAVGITKRIGRHVSLLRRGKHHSIKLQRSWNKHGEQAFSFDVLAIVSDPAALIACEQEWLDALDTVEHGYNIVPTAGSQLGFKHAPETRQRMSRPKSAEHCAAISAARCGVKLSAEHCAAVSAAMLGKKRGPYGPNGKTLSAEHRAAVSAAQRARTRGPLSVEHRAAVSNGYKKWSAARAAARANKAVATT